MPEKRNIPTTTLLITKSTDFLVLHAAYRIWRYELPDDLRWKFKNAKKPSEMWARMQNSLQAQIDYPYRVFTHDQRDGGLHHKWVVYVLASRPLPPQSVILPFGSDEELSYTFMECADLPFHMLIKLLQVAYMHGKQVGRFTGQGRCYVHAKRNDDVSHICVQLDLHEDILTQEEDQVRQFKVEVQAKLFQRCQADSYVVPHEAYFRRREAPDGTVYFLQMKPDELKRLKGENGVIYKIGTRHGKKTTLAYHNLFYIDESTGKILSDFISGFRQFLWQYGIESQSHMRAFSEYITLKERELRLKRMPFQTVFVFDHRKKKTHPLKAYLELFQDMLRSEDLDDHFPDVHFQNVEDLSQLQQPALILQDYQQKDFLEGGVFFGEIDPYQELYRRYNDLPKQTLNVNTLDAKNLDKDKYWSYPLPKKSQFKHKLGASLMELALKTILYADKAVFEYLPCLPEQLMYACRRRNVAGLAEPFETLMYVENDRLRFFDLRDPEQRIQAQERCLRIGVDFLGGLEQMIVKYKREDKPEEEQVPPSYRVIIGPHLFVEIENCRERVLYDYDEIVRRQQEVKTRLPVEMFKLLPYYNVVKRKDYVSLEELHRRDLLHTKKEPKSQKEAHSLHLYTQLENYDAYLDEIQLEYSLLSFKELTDEEMPFVEKIRSLLEVEANKNGEYTNHKLIGYYQKRGWFQSDKGKSVHMYQGIWYDDDHCYMVGAKDGMQYEQPRAHLIRRFDVYQGEEQFDIQMLLPMLSVQFVRWEQYTVYPYPFHLIDLYVENILLFGDGQKSAEKELLQR